MNIAFSVLAFAVIEAVALLFVLRAVRQTRTPQGAAAWVVFLLAAPFLAVPAYLVFGQSRFEGHSAARRDTRKVLAGLDQLDEAHGVRFGRRKDPLAGRSLALERLARMPVVAGNDCRILIDGAETFAAIFEAIERARDYLLVEFYILRDDRIGQELNARLAERARAGVEVRVLYDSIGSSALSLRFVEELHAAGVKIRQSHADRRLFSRLQVNFRNHRKIVVVDGEIGFVGGHNVGDEYMGRDPDFGHWRDTHVRVEGPVVAQLQLIFAEDWHWATGEMLKLDWTVPEETGNVRSLVLATGPGDRLESGALYFCNLIGTATERLWIASPYCVPDLDILSALKLAALRGVDVRILVPEKRDHLLVWLAAFAYFDELREAGVKIYRYADGFMHQKVVVVDERMVSIGTHNLDSRSCRLNFEVSLIAFGAVLTGAAARMLEADFAASRLHDEPLGNAPFFRRLGAPVARMFAPVL